MELPVVSSEQMLYDYWSKLMDYKIEEISEPLKYSNENRLAYRIFVSFPKDFEEKIIDCIKHCSSPHSVGLDPITFKNITYTPKSFFSSRRSIFINIFFQQQLIYSDTIKNRIFFEFQVFKGPLSKNEIIQIIKEHINNIDCFIDELLEKRFDYERDNMLYIGSSFDDND
jgi:hypothetical protein